MARLKGKDRKYYEEQEEKRNEYLKQYYEQNKTERLDKMKAYRDKNTEAMKTEWKKYYEENKERHTIQQKRKVKTECECGGQDTRDSQETIGLNISEHENTRIM